jgi:hypothetical protein
MTWWSRGGVVDLQPLAVRFVGQVCGSAFSGRVNFACTIALEVGTEEIRQVGEDQHGWLTVHIEGDDRCERHRDGNCKCHADRRFGHPDDRMPGTHYLSVGNKYACVCYMSHAWASNSQISRPNVRLVHMVMYWCSVLKQSTQHIYNLFQFHVAHGITDGKYLVGVVHESVARVFHLTQTQALELRGRGREVVIVSLCNACVWRAGGGGGGGECGRRGRVGDLQFRAHFRRE